MIGYGLCVLAFFGTLLAARRSLGAGLAAMATVGYAYGIIRANFLSAPTHMLFDCGVIGLYLGAGGRVFSAVSANPALRRLLVWAAVLIGWPLLLFFVPGYDPLIQLVGLRGNAFLLPFLLAGAALREDDVKLLAVWLAVLNLCALALAGAEYFTDVRLFFPMNAVTEIIYNSNDLAGYTAYRIPSSFANAHAYAGTMVVSLTFLLGALAQTHASRWRAALVYAGAAAALVGVFVAATRLHAIVLFVVVVAVTLFGGFSRQKLALWAAAIVAVGFLVSSDERLQRFSTLQDSAMVQQRVGGSVNANVFDAVSGYPLGNGLAGGGTSIPYFLRAGAGPIVAVENEYGRIGIEQGTVGLVLWIAFVAWFVFRIPGSRTDRWFVGRLAAWVAVCTYFGTGLIGTGLLTSIPHSSLMLTMTGWVVAPAFATRAVAVSQSSSQAPLRPGWRRVGSV